MKPNPFHHPDICWPIVRRRAGEELLDLVASMGDVIATAGRSLNRQSTFPNQKARKMTLYRLRKAGLIVRKSAEDDRAPSLELTDLGRARQPRMMKPERYWSKKWSGIWYIFMFDVPEKDRKYRNVLREFLKRLRLGCLQRSVWVTPHDIRPEYSDLADVAGAEEYTYLFESAMVLGRSQRDVVESAWDFETLKLLQTRFIAVCDEFRCRIERETVSEEDTLHFARYENSAYLSAMLNDPLLPEGLWPKGYQGMMAHATHCKVTREMKRHLKRLR